MFFRLLKPVRLLVRAAVATDGPRRIALGFALGMMLGLVPKGNLTATALCVLFFALRVNLAAGFLSAMLFTWLSGWTDPVAHRIGFALLTDAHFQPFWARLFRWPLVPWTALDNTVVLGNLLLGAWLFYPVYRLSQAALNRCRPRLVAVLERYRVGTLLAGTEAAARWRMG